MLPLNISYTPLDGSVRPSRCSAPYPPNRNIAGVACRSTCVGEVYVSVSSSWSSRYSLLRVRLNVSDVNDHAPRFSRSTVVVDVSESAALGKTVPLPAATDLDAPGHNSRLSFEVRWNGSAAGKLDFRVSPHLLLSRIFSVVKAKFHGSSFLNFLATAGRKLLPWNLVLRHPSVGHTKSRHVYPVDEHRPYSLRKSISQQI